MPAGGSPAAAFGTILTAEASGLKRKSGVNPVRSRHCNWRDALSFASHPTRNASHCSPRASGKAEERRYQPSARRPASGCDPAALRGTSGRNPGIVRGPPDHSRRLHHPTANSAVGFLFWQRLTTPSALLRRAGSSSTAPSGRAFIKFALPSPLGDNQRDGHLWTHFHD
jgi:hypothetical protein